MPFVLTGEILVARLKVLRNQKEYADMALEEGKMYSIGRKEDSDLVLQSDPGISRTHLNIEFGEGHWRVFALSQHIPINYKGRSTTKLVCEEETTSFFIPPYQFNLVLENELQQEPPLQPEAADFAPEAPPLEEAAPAFPEMDAPPEGMFAEAAEAVEAHVDGEFDGSDEKTSEIHLSGEPYLKFMFASHSESIRLKGNKWIAGRDSIAQIHLDDKKASRQHFSLEKVGEQYFIKDLKSANGSLLNGQELRPNELREIKSGDIITVNQLTIIFELRDLSFSEKLKDLPLQAYNGPMILTSQEWDLGSPQVVMPKVLSTAQLAQLPGTAQKVAAKKGMNLRTLLMGGAALVILAAVYFNQDAPRTPAAGDAQAKTYEALTDDDKRLVRDSYSLMLNLYQEGKIQNALNEVGRIHKIIPFYKDSKEIEIRLIEAQETLRQKEFIAQQRMEQERTKMKVRAIVADCRDRFSNATEIEGAQSCLNEALQLDPENGDAQMLLSSISVRMTEALERDKKQKEYNDSVEKGRELYIKAKNLFQNKEYQEAINAFSSHINAQLPDPDNLKDNSKRSIASIESMINRQKQDLMMKAQGMVTNGQLREAILHAEQAKAIDPFDYKTSNFIEQTKNDLTGQMRNLYTDSVIEERFGNLELSKTKWREIVNRDVPNGDYYLKAKRKLQQYGL